MIIPDIWLKFQQTVNIATIFLNSARYASFWKNTQVGAQEGVEAAVWKAVTRVTVAKVPFP